MSTVTGPLAPPVFSTNSLQEGSLTFSQFAMALHLLCFGCELVQTEVECA